MGIEAEYLEIPLVTSAGTNLESSNSSTGPIKMVGGEFESGFLIIFRLDASRK